MPAFDDSRAARDPAFVLRAGARPVPLTVTEMRVVPTAAARLMVASVAGAGLVLGVVLRGLWRRGR